MQETLKIPKKPKTSAAQRRAADKYISGLDEIRVRVDKGGKEVIKAHAASKGMSLNGYICELIQRDMETKETVSFLSDRLVGLVPSDIDEDKTKTERLSKQTI